MYDNKIRLSPDVLEKAQRIAQEWGLKNARAAVEAVFRRYSDEYLKGPGSSEAMGNAIATPTGNSMTRSPSPAASPKAAPNPDCEALSELDELLGL